MLFFDIWRKHCRCWNVITASINLQHSLVVKPSISGHIGVSKRQKGTSQLQLYKIDPIQPQKELFWVKNPSGAPFYGRWNAENSFTTSSDWALGRGTGGAAPNLVPSIHMLERQNMTKPRSEMQPANTSKFVPFKLKMRVVSNGVDCKTNGIWLTCRWCLQ